MTPLPEFGIKRENEERRDGGCAIALGYDKTGSLADLRQYL